MRTPACPTLVGRINHTIKKVRRKNEKPRKLNTYALRQQELKMEMHQRARRKEENWKIRQKLKQSITAVTPMTNTWLTRKYLGRVRKRKKPKLNNIRRGIMGLIRQVMVRKYGGRIGAINQRTPPIILCRNESSTTRYPYTSPLVQDHYLQCWGQTKDINQAIRKVAGLWWESMWYSWYQPKMWHDYTSLINIRLYAARLMSSVTPGGPGAV